MDIKMVDVTVHIDETLDDARREQVVAHMLEQDGVLAASIHKEHAHLMVVEYNPDKITSAQLLESVKNEGVSAELVGL